MPDHTRQARFGSILVAGDPDERQIARTASCADRFREWHVTHLYHRIFDEFRIVDGTNTSRVDDFDKIVRWLEFPGCLFQRNNLVLDSEIRSEGVIKPGLYISV